MPDILSPLFLKKDVKLSSLRHNDLWAYRKEGFGGELLERWPVTGFFRLWAEGRKDEAQQEFCAWYGEQFSRYGAVPKSSGGLYGGTLYLLAEKMHKEAGKPFDALAWALDESILRQAVEQRVKQRLDFLRAFSEKGFVFDGRDPVEGIARGGVIVLQGGHHRAAALMALGKTTVPAMLVFPSRFVSRIGHAVLRHGFIPRVAERR